MKFYHGTTEEHWKEIQKEGVLWGRKNQYWCGHKMSRINQFAKEKKNAGIYNDKGLTEKLCIILEVDFPEIKEWEGWQMTTYKPIPIARVKLLNKREKK